MVKEILVSLVELQQVKRAVFYAAGGRNPGFSRGKAE